MQTKPIYDLSTEILNIAREHADMHRVIAQKAHETVQHEIALLKGLLSLAQQQVASQRLEIESLRAEIRKIGRGPVTVSAIAGDSR